MASSRQLDFHNKLKVKRVAVPKLPKLPTPPKFVDPNKQLDIFGAIEKAQKKLNAVAARSAKRKQRQAVSKPRPKRGKLYRQSILAANSNPLIQERLNKAGVPNAILQFPKQYNLETGNFNFGKGFTERTFYGGAKQSAKTQAAAAKNILKRAKRIKRVSVRAVAAISLGSIVAAGINKKVNANKVPKGYKMVFGKLKRVSSL